MACQWCSIRRGSWPTRYSASSATASATVRARPSRIGSPRPTRPSSVYIFRNSQRGLTKNVSSLVIFIPSPLNRELAVERGETSVGEWALGVGAGGWVGSHGSDGSVVARAEDPAPNAQHPTPNTQLLTPNA